MKAVSYLRGTHKGSFQGIPATGKKIKARGVQIGRFENGKLVERWGSSDELGIQKGIGSWWKRSFLPGSRWE